MYDHANEVSSMLQLSRTWWKAKPLDLSDRTWLPSLRRTAVLLHHSECFAQETIPLILVWSAGEGPALRSR